MDKEVLTLVNMLNDKYVNVYKDEHNNKIVDGNKIIKDKKKEKKKFITYNYRKNIKILFYYSLFASSRNF